MSYVYILLEPQSKKFYIGSCENVNERFQRHIDELNRDAHHNQNMQELHNDGKEFYLFYGEHETREEAYQEEEKLIKENKDNPLMLNISLGARGGDNLTLNPNREAIIQKMTDHLKVRYSQLSEEERKAKYGRSGEANGMYGKNHSEESKQKMSDTAKGRPTWNKGIPMTEEHKQKFMTYIENRDTSGEANPFFGKSHSEETKEKISETKRRNLIDKFNRGEDLGRVTPVIIHGKVFITVADAAKEYGIGVTTVTYRVKSTLDTWKEWQYYKRPESIENVPMEETV
ncbi:putative homing endonuclease [Vibrio phage phiKT1028]|nr:putative homing endonuclease [Vibrio phage phiKT1028]